MQRQRLQQSPLWLKLRLHLIDVPRRPGFCILETGETWLITIIISAKSQSSFKSGSTTCVSGSPNLQLYSRTFSDYERDEYLRNWWNTLTPVDVTINPAYKIPTNGYPEITVNTRKKNHDAPPSFRIPSIVGFKTVCWTSFKNDFVATGVGAYAPIPPVFNPFYEFQFISNLEFNIPCHLPKHVYDLGQAREE